MTAALVIVLAASLCLTPIVRAVSLRTRRFGHPAPDAAVPVPPTGGIAVFLAFLAFVLIYPGAVPVPLAFGATVVVLTGLLDDVRPLQPVQKLTLQAVAAAGAVFLGLRVDLFGSAAVDGLVTGFWLVWMSNAFNVLDMMDGLAAGVGVLAGIGMALLPGAHTGMSLAVAAALAGFLVYNYHPARIYMGDTGSLFVGFTLAGAGVLASRALPSPQFALCPLLILGVPTFEAVFLTVVRRRKGLPVMRASRDHVAQRLVCLGASPRGAVGRIHLAALVLAALAVMGARGPGWLCWTYLAGSVAIALALGVRLGRVQTGLA